MSDVHSHPFFWAKEAQAILESAGNGSQLALLRKYQHIQLPSAMETDEVEAKCDLLNKQDWLWNMLDRVT